MEDSIINVLANDNFIVVNRSLIKILGLKETIILGELASEYNYYKNNELLDENGYFYSTIENIENNTTLSSYEQKKCLDNLSNRGIVSVVLKGIPAKRHIKINTLPIINLFANNLETSFQKIKKLDCEKLGTNNNNIKNNNKNNNINTKKKVIKEKYGTYGRVKLTTDEYLKLVNEFGEDFIKQQIELLDEYVESNNNKNKYSNFNLVLRKSIRENWFKKNNKKGGSSSFLDTMKEIYDQSRNNN